MKLCPKCNHSPLPFLMVFVVASVSAFVTWLTVGLSITQTTPRAAASALAFVVVGWAVLHYVLSCLRRHCRHDERLELRRAVLQLPGQPGEDPPASRLGALGAAAADI